MARAQGINAEMRVATEATYGTAPSAAAFRKQPFVSHSLGVERGLVEDDQLGGGRNGFDPTPDVVTNDGDVVVPVDTDAFGWWLRAMFGPPVTSGTTDKTHLFTAGATTLPSMSIEFGHPDVPSYSNNFGAVANQLRIQMTRGGLLNATIGIIAQGEEPKSNTSKAPSAAMVRGPRFAQATGQVSKDGVQLGNVVSTDITISNGLDKVEVIRPDGMIDGVDPGRLMVSGSTTVRFADHVLLDAATNNTPMALNLGWTNGTRSLVFAMPRVFLPRVKRPITGPGGIQATFNWQASGANAAMITASLVNQVASYA